MDYTENQTEVLQSPEKKQACHALANGHRPEKASSSKMCATCKTDWNLVQKRDGGKPSQLGLTSHVARCQACGVMAHDRPCAVKRTIHEIAEWSSLTCFEMVHTKTGFDLWQRSSDISDAAGETEDKKQHGYNAKTSHPKHLELAQMLGTGPKRRTGTSVHSAATTPRVGDINEEDSSNNSGDNSESEEDSPAMAPLNLINVGRCHNNNA